MLIEPPTWPEYFGFLGSWLVANWKSAAISQVFPAITGCQTIAVANDMSLVSVSNVTRKVVISSDCSDDGKPGHPSGRRFLKKSATLMVWPGSSPPENCQP